MDVDEKRLNLECDRLEDLFAVRGLMVRVSGGTVTPSTVQYNMYPAFGTKVSAIRGLADEMQMVLDARSCQIRQEGRRVVLEVPREEQDVVEFWPLYKRVVGTGALDHVTALLGLCDSGQPLLACLSSPRVGHVLVSGTTGAGKSVLLRSMVLSLVRLNAVAWLKLVLIDPKGETFAPFHPLRHVQWGVITEPARALGALERLVEEMEARQGPGPFSPTVVVFIDELADLAMSQGGPFIDAVSRLVARGRTAGIHVVAATQKPSTAVIGPLMKANFPVRICFAVTSSTDAKVATGWSGTGAEKLPMGGAGICIAEGQQIRFQGAYIDDGDLTTIVGGMPACRGRDLVVAKAGGLDRGLHPLERVQPLDAPVPLVREPEEVRLARKLLEWEKWPARWRSELKLDYRYGFISDACQCPFDRAGAGWHVRKTKEVIAKAEELEAKEAGDE